MFIFQFSDFNQIFFYIFFHMCPMRTQRIHDCWLVGWLVAFYGISTFVGYLTPNLFLYK